MGFISEESIQRVADANDIVDVVGSYFPLKRAGTSFRALCPFHQEKSPSFHVNPSRQSYHCFGCGAGGGVLRFVMDYEHVDFPSAVRRLAQRANIPLVEEASTPEDERKHGLRKRLLALHAEAALWFHHNLLKSADGATARDYLKSRGLTSEIAKSWKLGYAPESWDALLNHLRDRKFSREEIEQSGLASSKDDRPGAQLYSRFRNRVMFPIHNDYGEVVAFSGRTLEADPKAAKYVNSPETPLFTKGRVLYGLDKTKRDLIEKNAAIVCEGQIDLISAFEAGVRTLHEGLAAWKRGASPGSPIDPALQVFLVLCRRVRGQHVKLLDAAQAACHSLLLLTDCFRFLWGFCFVASASRYHCSCCSEGRQPQEFAARPVGCPGCYAWQK